MNMNNTFHRIVATLVITGCILFGLFLSIWFWVYVIQFTKLVIGFTLIGGFFYFFFLVFLPALWRELTGTSDRHIKLEEARIKQEKEQIKLYKEQLKLWNERIEKEREEHARKEREFTNLVLQCAPPERQDLVVESVDYKRENDKDRSYRRKYLLKLLELYNNSCAICKRQDNGLDLDHFFIPKSYGGNFIVLQTNGIEVNNAVPLCESCNRAKSDKNWKEFVPQAQLQEILNINSKVNTIINNIEISSYETI